MFGSIFNTYHGAPTDITLHHHSLQPCVTVCNQI